LSDPTTQLYRISVFITAIPSFLIILLIPSTLRILIFSQVVLSIQLPFMFIPLLALCRDRRVMGVFRSSLREFIAAMIVSGIAIVLNTYLLWSTTAKGR
jgi:manganese transport protein